MQRGGKNSTCCSQTAELVAVEEKLVEFLQVRNAQSAQVAGKFVPRQGCRLGAERGRQRERQTDAVSARSHQANRPITNKFKFERCRPQ